MALPSDLREHGDYPDHQNCRADYVGAFWNVIDWNRAAANFNNAKG